MIDLVQGIDFYVKLIILHTVIILHISIDPEMGASQNRDSYVSIYLNVDRQYYVAGQIIQGEVYLDVKADRNYKSLTLILDGTEAVMWTQQHDKHTHYYTNNYKNYFNQALLMDFNGVLPQGQYVFPFALLLPNMMTGSFYISSSCHLKYMLRAVLIHPLSQDKSIMYQMFLNVLEPPRTPIRPIGLTNSQESKCCGCCCSYGTTGVTLNCDRNFVRNGDTINVKGSIDNRLGTKNVKSAQILLQQVLFQISHDNHTSIDVETDFTLHRVNVQTKPGQVQDFSFSAVIPDDIVDCTAIGRIISRYFVLHLYTSYGCCANTAQSILHIVVHSKTPTIVQKKQIQAPTSWNPKIYQKIDLFNVTPYLYSPLPQLPFLNIPGQDNVKINLVLQKDMERMQQNIGYELGKQIVFDNNQKYIYNPRFYGQNVFSEEQKIQQGYQPFFNNQNQVESERQLNSIR